MKLLNRTATKTHALNMARVTGRKFTRVSESFLARIEDRVRQVIAAEVHAHPSTGMTLK